MSDDAHRLQPRRAVSTDVPAIRRLIDDSVRGLSRGYYTDAQIESALVHVFGVDTQLIHDGSYFVIDAGAELAAAGGWSKRRTLYGGDQFKETADPLLDPAVDAARIRAFFVHPSWTRRGLARRLFDACLVAARAEDFRHFELGATLPGVPLYEALGFVAIEEQAARMPDGESLPLIRMRRAIDASAGNTDRSLR
ncbi:MAG TPA: GNAT family N-acetyltransferase [Gemmatimonadaceae bacterium]